MRKTNDGTEDFHFQVNPKKHPWAAQNSEERLSPAPTPSPQAPEHRSNTDNENALDSFKYEPDPNKHPWVVKKGSKQ